MVLVVPAAQLALQLAFALPQVGSGSQKPQVTEFGSLLQISCGGQPPPQVLSQIRVPQVAELGSLSQICPAGGVPPPQVTSQTQMFAVGLQT